MVQPRLAVSEAFRKTSQTAAREIFKSDVFDQSEAVVAERYARLCAAFDKYMGKVAGILAHHQVNLTGFGSAEWLSAANAHLVGSAAPEEEIVAAFQRRWRQRLERGIRTKSGQGRPARREPAFEMLAGKLWRDAKKRALGKVTVEQLASIADELDKAGYIPPAEFLEKRAADEVKTFNSRNANSKQHPPINTWAALVRSDDKDHLTGMRRLLYHLADVRK